jgi:L-iditol 2-dehydrogenase
MTYFVHVHILHAMHVLTLAGTVMVTIHCLVMNDDFIRRYDGTLQPYVIYPSDFCYKLPDNVSYDEAAVIEPLSVAMQAMKRGDLKAGHNVLICGAGPIGLITLLACKAAGACQIVVTDIKDERLQVAKELGATLTINTATETLSSTLHRSGLNQADVSIECSGSERAVTDAIENTVSGGVCVLVGMGGGSTMNLPIAAASVREIDIRGVFRYANTYCKAIGMIAAGVINVKPLITHHFQLSDLLQAFQVAKDGRDSTGKSAIKCMIHVNKA